MNSVTAMTAELFSRSLAMNLTQVGIWVDQISKWPRGFCRPVQTFFRCPKSLQAGMFGVRHAAGLNLAGVNIPGGTYNEDLVWC